MLTYKEHLPIDELVSFLDTASGSITITKLKISWENGHGSNDDEGDTPYEHTHVLIQFDKPGEWYIKSLF